MIFPPGVTILRLSSLGCVYYDFFWICGEIRGVLGGRWVNTNSEESVAEVIALIENNPLVRDVRSGDGITKGHGWHT